MPSDLRSGVSLVLVVSHQITLSCALAVPWPSPRERVASSSRSQIAMRTASAGESLTWEAPSVGIRWSPPLSVAIISHLITRLLASRRPARTGRPRASSSLTSPFVQVVCEDDHTGMSSAPLRLLQGPHKSWMLFAVFVPPRDQGTLWSKWRSSVAPHCTHLP